VIRWKRPFAIKSLLVNGQMEQGERGRFIAETIDEAIDNDSSGTRYVKSYQYQCGQDLISDVSKKFVKVQVVVKPTGTARSHLV